MTELNLANELFNRFGAVTRARFCYLYTKKNERLLDLYQQGGKAILGWGSSKATTLFKNVLNRGITGSYFTEFNDKIEKSVSALLESQRKCFIYTSRKAALKNALTISINDTSFYRPWNSSNINISQKDCLILEPVLPWSENIFIVAAKPELTENKEIENSTELPAPLSAAIGKSFYELKKELPLRQEKDWFIYDTIITKYWTRKGPYLFPKVPEEKYDQFVLHCLDQKLVISPEYNKPSIIPFGADAGNFSGLKNNPFDFQE